MKIMKYIASLLLVGTCAFAQFPTNSTSTNLSASAATSDYNSFVFDWSAENDQLITATFPVSVTNGTFGLRLAKSKSGPVWLELTGWTCSGSTASIGFIGSNVPPASIYYAEFGLQSGGSFRTLAKGKVNVMSSLWSSTNYYVSTVSGNIVTTNINIPNFTWVGTFPTGNIPANVWAPVNTSVSRDEGQLKCKILTGTISSPSAAFSTAHGITGTIVSVSGVALNTSGGNFNHEPLPSWPYTWANNNDYWISNLAGAGMTLSNNATFRTLIWYIP